MKRVAAKVERIANACIIAAALIFVFVLGRAVVSYRHSAIPRQSSIEKGIKLLPDRDWSLSPHTLVLVLSADCKYCKASAPFYRRLVAQTSPSNTKLLALLPQSPDESKKYLADLQIKVDDVKQMAPVSVGAKGTPTLILIDANGVVIRSWEGLLPPDAESEVLASVK